MWGCLEIWVFIGKPQQLMEMSLGLVFRTSIMTPWHGNTFHITCHLVRGIQGAPVDSPHKKPVMHIIGVFFIVSMNKLLNKQYGCHSFWTPLCSCEQSYDTRPNFLITCTCPCTQQCQAISINTVTKKVNPSHAKLYIGNIKTYLQFISFFYTDMAQVVEILLHVRQELTYSSQYHG